MTLFLLHYVVPKLVSDTFGILDVRGAFTLLHGSKKVTLYLTIGIPIDTAAAAACSSSPRSFCIRFPVELRHLFGDYAGQRFSDLHELKGSTSENVKVLRHSLRMKECLPIRLIPHVLQIFNSTLNLVRNMLHPV